MRKKLVSCILVVCMLLSMLPTMAWAEPVATDSNLTPVATPSDVTLDIADGSIVITDTGYQQGDAGLVEWGTNTEHKLTIKGSKTQETPLVLVQGGSPIITLDNVTMALALDDPNEVWDTAKNKRQPAIAVYKEQSATIILSGDNAVTSWNGAGMQVPKDATVTIKGDGTLTGSVGSVLLSTYTGGDNTFRAGGNVILESGTLKTALYAGNGGVNFTMNGGTMEGAIDTKQSVTLNGGVLIGKIKGAPTSVTAGGMFYASNIGALYTDATYLPTELAVFANGTAAANAEVNVTYNSKTLTVSTDEQGLVRYLYLPDNATINVSVGGDTYNDVSVNDGKALAGPSCLCGNGSGTLTIDPVDSVIITEDKDITLNATFTNENCLLPEGFHGEYETTTYEVTKVMRGETEVANQQLASIAGNTLKVKNDSTNGTYTVYVKATCGPNAAKVTSEEIAIMVIPYQTAAANALLDIANGSVEISETGYIQNNAAFLWADDNTDHALTITGTAEGNAVVVKSGNPIVTLDDVSITAETPITVEGTQNVVINLSGANTLTSTAKRGIDAGSANVTINGTDADKLTISTVADGAGIYAMTTTVNGGSFDIDAEGFGIGRVQGAAGRTVVINGGIFDITATRTPFGTFNGAFTMNGGTLKALNGTVAAGGGTITINGGNVNGYFDGEVAGRELVKLYFVKDGGAADANAKKTVTVDSAASWDAYTDADGVITTYLPVDAQEVNGTEELNGGWLIGAECACNPTAFDWTGTASTAEVFSTAMTIPVSVTVGKCAMPIHKLADVAWTVSGNAEKTDDGKLTLKPAAADYTVTLTATLDGYPNLTNATHEITVTADSSIKSIDIGKGPVAVVDGSAEGKVTYKQYSGVLVDEDGNLQLDEDGNLQYTNETSLYSDVPATEKVIFFGEYVFDAGNVIMVTDCGPTIVLKDVTIEAKAASQAYSNILIDGEASDEVKLILSGTNTIIRGDGTHSSQKINYYNGIEIRNATLIIDCECENGADCKDTACADKLIVTLGNARSAAIGSRQESNWAANGEPEGYTLNIEGGQIEATTENFGAAIGTSWISGNIITNVVNININDGYVKAVASDAGVAIGSGRSDNEPKEGVVNVNITGGEVEAVSISVHSNNSSSYAINASNVTISGDADTTVKGVARMKTIEIKDDASLDMQKKEGWTEEHGRNPGGSISNGAEWNVKDEAGNVIETVVRAGNTKVIVSGNASLVTDGGIDGTLSTSGNATAEIKGVAPRSGVASTDKNVGGVSGTVTVGEGSTVSVTEEIKKEVIIEGGATINGATLPEDAGTTTIPAGKAGELKADDEGNVSLPADSTITKADGSSVNLSKGGTMAADGAITAGGTVTTKDAQGNVVSTVVVPEGKNATVSADGKVTAPAGTTIKQEGKEDVVLDNGGTVDKDGAVTETPVTPPSSGDEGDKPTPQPPYSGYYPSYTPSVTPAAPSVDSSSLNNAALAVGSAIKDGSAEFTPVNGYTKDEVLQLQKDGKLRMGIEKTVGYGSVADKNLAEAAIKSAGGAVSGTSVLYFDITPVLKLDNGTVVAHVTDTEKAITITIELSDELTKAAKDGKDIAVVRVHDGKAEFLSAKLNSAKTKVTFSSADFSTYAVVALNKATSAKTFDAGVAMYVGMAVLAATGSAVVVGKKRK